MSKDTKILVKTAKEVFASVKDSQDFSFDFPDYAGVSQSVVNQLSNEHLDAIAAAVYAYESRPDMTANDFVSLAKDEFEIINPQHEKTSRHVVPKKNFAG